MWHKYIMEIKKDGYMKYISHLDMVKLFKNAFKKSGIKLAYSQGFNPHPKMGFAQPLSLGYSSTCEILEFEVQESIEPTAVIEQLQSSLPKGIEILSCEAFTHNKSFAARTFAATYEIVIPIDLTAVSDDSVLKQLSELMLKLKEENCDIRCDLKEICEAFLEQEKIITLKKQKKTGKHVEVDIKNMIRTLNAVYVDAVSDFASNPVNSSSVNLPPGILTESKMPAIVLTTTLDSGSNSNLSPELVFTTFASFTGIDTAREEVDIKRTALFFE